MNVKPYWGTPPLDGFVLCGEVTHSQLAVDAYRARYHGIPGHFHPDYHKVRFVFPKEAHAAEFPDWVSGAWLRDVSLSDPVGRVVCHCLDTQTLLHAVYCESDEHAGWFELVGFGDGLAMFSREFLLDGGE